METQLILDIQSKTVTYKLHKKLLISSRRIVWQPSLFFATRSSAAVYCAYKHTVVKSKPQMKTFAGSVLHRQLGNNPCSLSLSLYFSREGGLAGVSLVQVPKRLSIVFHVAAALHI